MHLRDTSIDIDGHILADGRLSYPPDDQGFFPPSRSGQFRISASDTLIRIAAAIAQRDPDSHFFVSKEVGAVVVIPEALSLLIRRALAARCPPSQQAQLAPGLGGSLWSSNDEPLKAKISNKQGLSDWLLSMQEIDGALSIRLSAALVDKRPTGWRSPPAKFWTCRGGESPRMELELQIDQVTRAACFGRSLGDPSKHESGTEISVNMTTITSLRLDSAVVARSYKQFGYTPAGRWVGLYESPIGLSIDLEPNHYLKRRPDGFVVSDWFCTTTINFIGLNLTVFSHILGNTRSATMEFRDGRFGRVTQHRSFYEGRDPYPQQHICEMIFQLRLVDHGLELAYQALVNDWDLSTKPYKPDWLKETITLPWELLILRHPYFLRRRWLLRESSSSNGISQSN